MSLTVHGIGVQVFVVFVCLILFVVVCHAVGRRFLPLFCLTDLEDDDGFILSVWLGAVTVASALLATALFVSLRPIAAAGVVGVLLLPMLAGYHGKRSRGTPPIWSIVVVLGAVSAALTMPVTFYDTGLYHIGAINWLSSYGVVRGLGLVHERFGFISTWFALAAPFNIGSLAGHLIALPGGLGLTLVATHSTVAACRFFRRTDRYCDRFVLIAYAAALILIGRWSLFLSPSPDLAVILGTIVVAWGMILLEERGLNEPQAWRKQLAFVFLAAGAVSFKISAVPVLMVALVLFLRLARLKSRAAFAFPAAILPLAPVLIASFITTGCFIFPVARTCVDLSWAFRSQEANQVAQTVRDWARTASKSPGDGAWVALWIRDSKLDASLMGATLGVGIAWFFRRPQVGVWAMILALGGAVFAFVNAPTARFFLGYTVTAVGLIGAALITGSRSFWKLPRWGSAIQAVTGVVMIASVCAFAATSSFHRLLRRDMTDRSAQWWLLPQAIPNGGSHDEGTTRVLFDLSFERKTSHNVTYLTPVGTDQCWNAPQPCTPRLPGPDIELRDPIRGLSAGFQRAQ